MRFVCNHNLYLSVNTYFINYLLKIVISNYLTLEESNLEAVTLNLEFYFTIQDKRVTFSSFKTFHFQFPSSTTLSSVDNSIVKAQKFHKRPHFSRLHRVN